MDNLGVAMNATTIEAYALSKGIKQSYNEMDNATKVGLAMEMFLEKTSYAAGNYAKENKTFAGSFNTLKAATSNFLSGAGGIEDVASSLINFSEILITSIGEMAPTIVEGLVSLTQTLIPQIPPLLQSLLPSVLEGAISLINGLVAIFPALLQMIQANLPSIVLGAITIIQTLITTILNMLPEVLKIGVTLLLEFMRGIAETIPQLIPTIIEVIMQIIGTLFDNLDKIIMIGIDILVALIEGIVEAIPKLIEMLPRIIASIITTLTSPIMIMKLLAAGVQILVALIKGIIETIPRLLLLPGQIVLDLVRKFKNTFGKIKNVGKELISGLWNGIKEKWESLKSNIENLGKGIVNKFKDVFGIHSPSRVFADEIGKQLSAGLGVGFEDELNNVYRDMQRAIDLETSKMSANVQTSGTYQMAMAGVPTFNLLDNTSNTTQLICNGKVLAEVVNTENKNREVATA